MTDDGKRSFALFEKINDLIIDEGLRRFRAGDGKLEDMASSAMAALTLALAFTMASVISIRGSDLDEGVEHVADHLKAQINLRLTELKANSSELHDLARKLAASNGMPDGHA